MIFNTGGLKMNDYLFQLKSDKMIVEFDKRNGAVYSIRETDCKFNTNYLGNEKNNAGVYENYPLSTGNIVSTVWKTTKEADENNLPGNWAMELSGKSDDIRNITYGKDFFTVSYNGRSKDPEGIKSYKLQITYRLQEDQSIIQEIEIENATDDILEIGEFGLPLLVNNNYGGLYEGEDYMQLAMSVESGNVQKQKWIHENMVLMHDYIGGHSSYVLMQRLLGNPAFLLIHPMQDTSLECCYKPYAWHKTGIRPGFQQWEQVDILAIHSRSTRLIRQWADDWINGHTSLILQPKEKKQYQFRYTFVESNEEVTEQLAQSGNLGIKVLPSMVVTENQDVYVEIKCQTDLDSIQILSDHVRIKNRTRTGNKTLLTLSFSRRGQKTLKLHHHKTRSTNLHFYCVEDYETLLKARSSFIIDRQFYENESDPYNRHHMFMPFNDRTGSWMVDGEEAWELGGSDEFGFSESLYLAEKNIYFPSLVEIETLETYVNDCLFKYIQNPETYEIRASLYWKDRIPSSPWGHWTEERSKETWRSYNYPHAANIYHALYKIGKLYGIKLTREPLDYLEMSYRTVMQWFAYGYWKQIGLMCGSNAIFILLDLQKEGRIEQYDALLKEIQACTKVFVDDPYPYGSELVIDQTAHEQVYYFTKFNGNTDKTDKTVQVLKALRGGNIPIWFRYGNDTRRFQPEIGTMSLWYSESLNGMALLDSFEDTKDLDTFIKGYAGLVSVMFDIRADGMGFGWFNYEPETFDYKPARTLDNGIALWGFLKGIKSYVLKDESFGWIGCGCDLEVRDSILTVYPKDGLRKRIVFVEDEVSIELVKGQIKSVVFDRTTKRLVLQLDDTSGLVEDAQLIVKGLERGKHSIVFKGSELEVEAEGTLEASVPLHSEVVIFKK
jgi:hypothetical protein